MRHRTPRNRDGALHQVCGIATREKRKKIANRRKFDRQTLGHLLGAMRINRKTDHLDHVGLAHFPRSSASAVKTDGSGVQGAQPTLNVIVALKLLPAKLAEREGRLLARLHHPIIVAVHDSGHSGAFFLLLMDRFDAGSRTAEPD